MLEASTNLAGWKSEIRNPKPETNSKGGKRKKPQTAPPDAVLDICPSDFGFVSDFGFRVSDLIGNQPQAAEFRCPRSAFQPFAVAATLRPLFPCPVLKTRSFLRYWLPVLVWMCVIFSASSDQMSFQHSSRIIGPFLHWLFPHLSDETIHSAVVTVRKCAHLTEYAALALLLWRALRKPAQPGPAPWQWSKAGLVLALVALYAASDEFHQAFVPSRQASVWDVLLDTTGAAIALLCLWAVGRLRRPRS